MFTKNIPIILTAVSMLLLGFALAWVIKPSESSNHDHASHDSEEGTVWTCSMDPQVRQPNPGSCPICGMDLVPAKKQDRENPLELKMTETAVQLAQIQTVKVGTQKSGPKTLRLSGKIQADERLAASQVAHVPGRIEKLYVTFTGEQIRRGQKLADIYSPELFTAQEELLQALKYERKNPELLAAARKKLEYWKISPEQIADIEKKQEAQSIFTLYADASGIVKERNVSLGDHVDPGDILFELQNLRNLWLLFDAYEEDLAQINIGDKIIFSTPALPGQEFTTRVSFIDPVINPDTRVASIRGEIPNRKGRLKPEMFVKGELESPTKGTESLFVPKSSVLWTGKRSIVYVKMPNREVPTYQYREVDLGERMGDQYQVLSGLESGDEVVSQGSFSIDAAAQLNNQNSMMNTWLEKENEPKSELVDFRDQVSPDFSRGLTEITANYLRLKDALVQTDASVAKSSSELFRKALSEVNANALPGDAKKFWEEKAHAFQVHGTKFSQSEDVEVQRKQFDFISQTLIQTLNAFGYSNGTLYIQHCPMAFDNQGADWLSLEERVLNPYFGEVMLTCGRIAGEVPKQKE